MGIGSLSGGGASGLKKFADLAVPLIPAGAVPPAPRTNAYLPTIASTGNPLIPQPAISPGPATGDIYGWALYSGRAGEGTEYLITNGLGWTFQVFGQPPFTPTSNAQVTYAGATNVRPLVAWRTWPAGGVPTMPTIRNSTTATPAYAIAEWVIPGGQGTPVSETHSPAFEYELSTFNGSGPSPLVAPRFRALPFSTVRIVSHYLSSNSMSAPTNGWTVVGATATGTWSSFVGIQAKSLLPQDESSGYSVTFGSSGETVVQTFKYHPAVAGGLTFSPILTPPTSDFFLDRFEVQNLSTTRAAYFSFLSGANFTSHVIQPRSSLVQGGVLLSPATAEVIGALQTDRETASLRALAIGRRVS